MSVTGDVAEPGLRPEIAESWFRVQACGLSPDSPLDRARPTDFDTDSTLLRAAGPVLSNLAGDLEGTRFALMLADREACIVDRRFSDASLEIALDGIGAVLGNRFTEETTGTNSIATALEVRHGIAIHATEHFMIPMKHFSCYGQPITNPVSRRVEGVLQITGPAEERNSLWAPVVKRAANDIAERLLAGTHLDQQRMLIAFQEASRRNSRVVLIGDDVVMCSSGAQRMLESADHVILRELARDARHTPCEMAVVLTGGTETRIRHQRVPDASGVVVEILDDQDRRPILRRRRTVPDRGDLLDGHRRDRARLLVVGEPGSGRSTALGRLAGDGGAAVANAADVVPGGEQSWTGLLARLLTETGGLVVVDNVHLLTPAAAARTAHLLRDSPAWFALTSGPLTDLGPEHAALTATCTAQLEIPPLRHRRDELPAIVRQTLDELVPHRRLHVANGVWEILRGHRWPGNLRELRSVLEHVAAGVAGGDSGVVSVEDLPHAYRTPRPARPLSLLEQVEHDAIVRALAECGGNKVHTAELLGISRTTLYKRIRRFGVAC